eukprot:TRINITY_DN105557_c0_g1_i1.p1 TRINITY_DN105557_c0_g1~~TRINITY_DN105557_c0_g1_i1.p1  ORF type:complete len:232 (-),score=51.60 TRINITY_DN105557_c0_g1_i1:29-643(-)
MGAACCSDINKAGDKPPPLLGQYPAVPPGAPPLPGEYPGFSPPQAPNGFVPAYGEQQAAAFNNPAEGPVENQGQDQVSDVVDEVTAKEQRQQAKQMVKDFVKEMVRGRKMNVMTQAGQLKTCVASLSRSLDALKIKVANQTRTIALRDIDEIAPGAEVEGISTPLDELCATLLLTDDCITFRFVDLNARDTFVMCLLMFCNSQK